MVLFGKLKLKLIINISNILVILVINFHIPVATHFIFIKHPNLHKLIRIELQKFISSLAVLIRQLFVKLPSRILNASSI